jgi:hypothetical protein
VRPDEKLYAALSGIAELNAATGGRIYPVRVPAEKGLPAIAYQRTTSVYDYVIHTQPPVTTLASFDIFCVAADYATAEALGDLIEELNVDGVKMVDRSSSQGEEEGAPFASIVTVEVDTQ